jgi:hypothetical protein
VNLEVDAEDLREGTSASTAAQTTAATNTPALAQRAPAAAAAAAARVQSAAASRPKELLCERRFRLLFHRLRWTDSR